MESYDSATVSESKSSVSESEDEIEFVGVSRSRAWKRARGVLAVKQGLWVLRWVRKLTCAFQT